VSPPGLGDAGGFVVDPALGEENFSVFSHEDDPAAWLEEASYVSFEWWLGRLVESAGVKRVV
jgi:hypothetical protein